MTPIGRPTPYVRGAIRTTRSHAAIACHRPLVQSAAVGDFSVATGRGPGHRQGGRHPARVLGGGVRRPVPPARRRRGPRAATSSGDVVRIFGLVTRVQRGTKARFDSHVFDVADGLLPAEIARAALVQATRFEPETLVPPSGRRVRRAMGDERLEALCFDGMAHRLPAGLAGGRARLREPGVPRWHGAARQRQRRLGGGHQDDVRHLPPLQPVHLGRARRRGPQHQGLGVQREGRGPLPRPREHRISWTTPPATGPRPQPGVQERGRLRPSSPRRPAPAPTSPAAPRA